jgi:hypothetical protein
MRMLEGRVGLQSYTAPQASSKLLLMTVIALRTKCSKVNRPIELPWIPL